MAEKSPRATASSQPTYVRLPRELHEAVKERSKAEGRSMALTVRDALRYYLSNAG